MSRLAPLAPPYADDVQASFDAIMPPGAAPLLLFRTLAASPRAWRKFRAGSLLDRGPLSLRQREIVIDRVCALAGCGYEWGVHVTAFARAARLTDDEIAATAAPDPSCASWTADEIVLIRTVDALHARATLDDGEFAALAVAFDRHQILEVLLLAGFYRTVAYVANGLALDPEPGAARLPPGPQAP